MDVELDRASVEKAERSLDEFINARSRAKAEANELVRRKRREGRQVILGRGGGGVR